MNFDPVVVNALLGIINQTKDIPSMQALNKAALDQLQQILEQKSDQSVEDLLDRIRRKHGLTPKGETNG